MLMEYNYINYFNLQVVKFYTIEKCKKILQNILYFSLLLFTILYFIILYFSLNTTSIFAKTLIASSAAFSK
jgi:hypothetical protein